MKSIPFVLASRKRLPESIPQPSSAWYDVTRGLWFDEGSDRPLICTLGGNGPTKFGETLITDSFEGADQSESSAVLSVSTHGETLMTRTVEGADHPECGDFLRASDFGETLMTKTMEGSDQRELASSQYGETSKTATAEGMDHGESIDDFV